MPAGIFEDYPLQRTERTGVEYGAANGGKIKNLGEKVLGLSLRSGDQYGFRFQVGGTATKALGSTCRIVGQGNRVVHDPRGSYILNLNTGKVNWLRRNNGQLILDAVVKPASFRRQGR